MKVYRSWAHCDNFRHKTKKTAFTHFKPTDLWAFNKAWAR